MSLPYYKPKYLPAFSLVLTSIEEDGVPVEIFALKDSRKALRRQVHINLSHSRAGPNSQPPDDDPLVRTADTRSWFSGSVAYDAEYLAGEEETTHHPHRTASTASTSSTSSSNSAEEDEEEDIASSTSTSEVDLNGELEVDRVSESDAATLYDCDLGELSDHNPPLDRQLAVVSSLAQTSPLPRHHYDEAIPMSVLNARPVSSEVPSVSSGRPRSSRPSPPSKNLGTTKFLLVFLRIFCSLWRRLKSIGGVILRDFTKDL